MTDARRTAKQRFNVGRNDVKMASVRPKALHTPIKLHTPVKLRRMRTVGQQLDATCQLRQQKTAKKKDLKRIEVVLLL